MRDEGISRQQYNALVAAFFFGVAAVGIGLLAILYSYKQVQDLRKEKAHLEASITMLQRQPGDNEVQKETPVANTNNNSDEAKERANSKAVNTTKATVSAEKTSEKKVPAKKGTAVAVAPKVLSREVVVSYYHRKADNVYLVATLQSLGYRFEGKMLGGNTGNERTNCIWYGAGVPAADVKKVATALIRSGTVIKGIKRFAPSHKNPSYKRNVIEVGREAYYEKHPIRAMTVADVEAAKF